MASLVTHIVYAEIVRKKFLTDRRIDEVKFYIGNVFPDIRYLVNISRKETHPRNPTVEKLLKINGSFELGTFCHVLVDKEREKILKKLGLYDLFPRSNFLFFALKFVEDEITYSKIKNWPKIISFFDSILVEEVKLAPQNSITKWHGLIKQYFSQPPTERTVIDFAVGLNFDKNTIKPILETIRRIKENSEALKLIKTTQEKLFY